MSLKVASDEWKTRRKRGIGGSDAAAALGLSRWKSPLRLYLEKIGEIEEEPDNEAMYWGRVLEDVVVKAFEERTGKKTRRVNHMLIHPQHSFMLANIDRRIVGEKALLEVKTTAQWNEEEWKGDEMPQEYIIQGQHYLAVTGYDKAYFAVLVGGRKLLIKELPRDEELIEMIIEGEKRFWEHVEKRIPPELDGSPDAEKILNYLYPVAQEGTTIELPPTAENLVEEIRLLSQQIKELETLKKEKENKLKEMIGEAEKAYVGNYVITWKNVVSMRFDTKKFKKDHPDLYAQYAKETLYRRFSIKEAG